MGRRREMPRVSGLHGPRGAEDLEMLLMVLVSGMRWLYSPDRKCFGHCTSRQAKSELIVLRSLLPGERVLPARHPRLISCVL